MKSRKITQSSTFSVALIVIAMLAIMRILKANYFSADNITALLKVLAITSIVGVSQMISMSSGGMNVSIGSTGALSAISAALCMQNIGLHPILAVVLGLTVGMLCGTVNGLLIYRNGGIGVASFLTTLATSSVFVGITLLITKGRGVSTIPEGFIAIGNSKVGPIPTSLFFTIAIVFIFYIFYKHSVYGRRILAFGANAKAAELYGISRFKIVLLVNILAGAVSALAGLLVVSRVGTAQPDIGTDWMLQSFAAPLIGGTLQAGGKPKPTNVFIF